MPDNVSKDAQDLIRKMLKTDPKKRITISKAL
jgi:serine/threonine protein kinase